ncbi:MAG: endonuclease III [Lachnospiraceae bacterium]|nr:endonuclease III [Lachnospiraceae bacterium]
MNRKIEQQLERLDEEYGTDIRIFLEYKEPYELLIATILSAQCTDKRVNEVTKDLFVKYPTLEAFDAAELKELEQDIRTCGFFKMKAKHIKGAVHKLIRDHNKEVPSDIRELTALPGVGRKTANVVRTHIFLIPSIVVDTHVKRVSRRLGWTKETDPEKIEFDLMKKIPEDHWCLINQDLITLGRSICHARTAECGACFMSGLCPRKGVKA